MTARRGPSGEAWLGGVVGWPVRHSLSPRLMTHWIEAAGLDAQYAPFEVGPDDFYEFVQGLARARTVRGLNVTLPHKQAALAIAGSASETARAIGAANLLTFHTDRVVAENTDVAGFLAALEPAGIAYPDSSALVLGAGGVSRALVYALVASGIGELVIANRNRGRAEALARDLAPRARIIDWDTRNNALPASDLIVNATSLGMKGEGSLGLDWDQAPEGCLAFDSVYTPLETGFLAGARAAGHRGIDGLDMLIGQARPAFASLFETEAPEATDPVRPVLVAALEAEA